MDLIIEKQRVCLVIPMYFIEIFFSVFTIWKQIYRIYVYLRIVSSQYAQLVIKAKLYLEYFVITLQNQAKNVRDQVLNIGKIGQNHVVNL